MKSKVSILLDKSISAMISAIEIYNKPNFKYREETFSILAINSWELLLKALWLKNNNNKINSLYEKNIKGRIKKSSSGNSLTHGLGYLLKKLLEQKQIDNCVYENIKILIEIRDSAVHFYNENITFSTSLQEIGSACVKNFVNAIKDFFNQDLSNYNFYLIPLAFVNCAEYSIINLNQEEKNIINYIQEIDSQQHNQTSNYSISISMDLKFVKSKTKEAMLVKYSNDENATKVKMTEEDFKIKYPLLAEDVKKKCKDRYLNFKQNKDFNLIWKNIKENEKYCYTRKLDPNKSGGQTKSFFSEALFVELDKHYTKKLN